jgi:MFS family permease
VEFRAKEPIIPLGMFRNRTFTLAVIASISVGVSMFGTSVFLSQYMQLARGATPTESGLLTIPMMGGLLISSTLFGNFISRRGTWKPVVVAGGVLVVAGTALLGTLQYDTNLVLVGLYMFVLGAGVGMLMQNLVLVVQNSIDVKHLGVATSAVTFFRALGGTIGVTVLGSILGTVVAQQIAGGIDTLSRADRREAASTLGDGSIPNVNELPEAIRILVEAAYGSGVGTLFMLTVPLAVVTLIAVTFLPNVPLGRKNAIQLRRKREAEDAEDTVIGVSAGSAALEPVGQARPTGSIPVIEQDTRPVSGTAKEQR